MERRVLMAIADRPRTVVPLGAAVGAAVAALLLGVAGGVAPTQAAHASPVGPIGVPSALAPSSLLAGPR